MKNYSAAVLVALGVVAAGEAGAYQAGDVIVRAGVASVQPNEDSGALKLDGAALPGTEAGVDNNEQLGLTFTYMLTLRTRHPGEGGRCRRRVHQAPPADPDAAVLSP